jgi:hypothetical protein
VFFIGFGIGFACVPRALTAHTRMSVCPVGLARTQRRAPRAAAFAPRACATHAAARGPRGHLLSNANQPCFGACTHRDARSGGQNVPPVVVFKAVQHSPPPPWFVKTASPPVPSWASVIGYSKLASAVLRTQSPSASWDRLTFDAASRRLFVSASADGVVSLSVDAVTAAPLVASAAAVTGSAGCNSMVLVPAVGSASPLGFCGDMGGPGARVSVGVNVYATPPGSAAVLLRTVPSAGVGVDNGVFDALSNQVVVTLLNGSLIAIDASTQAQRGSLNLVTRVCAADGSPCNLLASPVVDGKGSLLVNAPLTNQLIRVNTSTLTLSATWNLALLGCSDPTGLDVDTVLGRLFVGCANPGAPILLVLDSTTGAKKASLPIGRGNDGVRWDATRGRIYVSSGVAANVVVIQQRVTAGVDAYAVREAITTKPGARTLTFDPVSGVIYTLAPDGRYDPTRPFDADAWGVSFYNNVWFPNTLEVIALAPPSPTA